MKIAFDNKHGKDWKSWCPNYVEGNKLKKTPEWWNEEKKTLKSEKMLNICVSMLGKSKHVANGSLQT